MDLTKHDLYRLAQEQNVSKRTKMSYSQLLKAVNIPMSPALAFILVLCESWMNCKIDKFSLPKSSIQQHLYKHGHRPTVVHKAYQGRELSELALQFLLKQYSVYTCRPPIELGFDGLNNVKQVRVYPDFIYATDFKLMTEYVKSCDNKPLMIFSMRLKCKSGYQHSNYMIINKINRTIEVYEPNGHQFNNCPAPRLLEALKQALHIPDDFELVHMNKTCPINVHSNVEVLKVEDGWCQLFAQYLLFLRLQHPTISLKYMNNAIASAIQDKLWWKNIANFLQKQIDILDHMAQTYLSYENYEKYKEVINHCGITSTDESCEMYFQNQSHRNQYDEVINALGNVLIR